MNEYNYILISLSKLKFHEEIDREYLEKLKSEILNDGFLRKPIVIDRETKVIIDGHHRAKALIEIGAELIPAIEIDYFSNEFLVESWRNDVKIKKKDIIKAGLENKLFPPKTSKNLIIINNEAKHISHIQKDVNISLEDLGYKIKDISK